jgi:transcriptional regulator with XRE-family HTH domain
MGSLIVNNRRGREIFAQNLNSVLRSAKLSEAELARRSGVSQKQINNTARDRTGTGIEIMTQIAYALGVSAYQLLIPNRFANDDPAEPVKLDSLIVAYLNATPEERGAFDVIAKSLDKNNRKADRNTARNVTQDTDSLGNANARTVRDLIKEAGLTQVGAAHALGINPRTMRRYVSLDPTVFRSPPQPVVLALRALTSSDTVRIGTARAHDRS